MMEYLEKTIEYFEKNTTKVYLILGNVFLAAFAIWLSNVGVLPFKNAGDFAIFTSLCLIFALYRPGWAFTLFIGMLALENINLAPASFGLAIRPYQLLAFLIILALLTRYLIKRMPFSLPKLVWIDALPLVFILGSLFSALFSQNRMVSFKQTIVAGTFVGIYFLVRLFIQSLGDLKRIAPFFLSTGIVASLYAILQNIRFYQGLNSFEVMPGRPNGTFTEADWLGIYLVFVLAVIFAMIYSIMIKKQGTINKQITNFKFQISKILLYLVSCILYLVLILTVSRSAWIGAVIVAVGFLKFVLYDGTFRISEFKWKSMLCELKNILITLAVSLVIVYAFGLTKFQIGNRVVSTGGLQKITIACDKREFNSQNARELNSQSIIRSVDELAQYGCRHINLEDINFEKAQGKNIAEVLRPDPNVGIRAKIYKTSLAQISQHPIVGIGWGSISKILGNDERGAGLNASNIFLEVWLGSGLLGILSLTILLGYIFGKGALIFFKKNDELKIVSAIVLLGWSAIVFPNLFNSGIFLGFVWLYLACAVSLLNIVLKK